MTRHTEVKTEEAVTRKNAALAKALDHGIVGGLEVQGIQLLGLSIRHSAMDCLVTLRADVGGVRKVAFIGSDTIVNCFLKCYSDVARDRLHWRVDKFGRK